MTRPETGDDYEKVFSRGYLFHTNEKEVAARLLRRLLGRARLGRVLDVGPGDATLTAVLAERARSLAAIEPQSGFARRLEERFPGVRVRRGLVQNQSFPRGSFDLILSSHMLYYLPLERWDAELSRWMTWLKPGGRLIVIMSAGDSDWYRSVSELSARLKTVPGFSYVCPEDYFRVFRGGADRLLGYRATFDFKGTTRELERFLIELELLTPHRLLSAAQRREVARYVRERRDRAGRFRLKNRYVVGVWRR